jgi:hypothetical protein
VVAVLLMLAALVLPSPESATTISWASVALNSASRWEVEGDARTTCRGDRGIAGGFEEIDEDCSVLLASGDWSTAEDLVGLGRLWRGYFPLLDSMSWQ